MCTTVYIPVMSDSCNNLVHKVVSVPHNSSIINIFASTQDCPLSAEYPNSIDVKKQ